MVLVADNFNTAQARGTRVADNFNQAVTFPPPTNLVLTPYDSAAQLNWTAPNGSDQVLRYDIVASQGTVVRTFTDNTIDTTTIIDLINGVTWTVTLSAIYQTGSAGITATVTPSASFGPPPGVEVPPILSRPDPPLLDSVTPYNAALVASWSPPASDGGSLIQFYSVTGVTATEQVTITVSGDINTATITGLTNATSYTVSVLAINNIGTSDPSNLITVTPLDTLNNVDATPPPPVDQGPRIIVAPFIWAFDRNVNLRPENWLKPFEDSI